ncbi:MAG: peptidoglycan-binding protein [Clostridia bacterium]|nr:peptidoglycan-binding protein [Clostridia bacterium]
MAKKKSLSLLLLVTLVTISLLAGLTSAYAAELGSRSLKEGMQGDDVKQLQITLKVRGYFKEESTGNYGPKTKEAVMSFQKAKGLKADGIAGQATITAINIRTVKKQVSRGGRPSVNGQEYVVKEGDSLWTISQQFGTTVDELIQVNNLESDALSIDQKLIIPGRKSGGQGTATYAGTQEEATKAEEPKETQPAAKEGYGEYADWWEDARYAFPIGAEATIRDFATGKTFKIKRYYGINHADVEPMTAEDTAVMKELYPKWSWDTRAIIVEVGDRQLAASMSGMPHSIETIGDSNNFTGHFDIHFLNSRSHNTNSIRADHQAMVKKAAGK